ncbi:hypothetical protein Moror_4287 [Moniliophthora roreri MCA 2997]|uniref:Uncharacterized protein n=1 Tax=Moniliophthora roreri (strain MCA 2997) TaxID=1381753 RepID=V2XCI9_MONRO|nr:hypothetical protein Moror_4287 [Moniliophthora roreri MCA 2997]
MDNFRFSTGCPAKPSKLTMPYKGKKRKLILAIDIGTTYSGVSFCLLEPGLVPEISFVTRYPGQLHGGDGKVQSFVFYDRDGNVKAAGAEATQDEVEREAEDNSWMLAEWWKLHLQESCHLESIPPLPPHKNPLEILTDFIRYIYSCAKNYLIELWGDSTSWDSIEDAIEIVLTHPNSWEDAVQQQLRQAIVRAGVLPDDQDGHSRTHLLTEGEACLHHCIKNLPIKLRADLKNVVIADAGGGTVDFSSYTTARGGKISPTARFREVAIPKSVLAGSIHVTKAFEKYVRKHLAGTRYEGGIDRVTREFDKTAKLRFRDNSQTFYINFASTTDDDETLGISRGQLKVSGAVAELFFAPALALVIDALDSQIDEAQALSDKVIQAVFLVGGFAGNEWLYTGIKSHLEQKGIDLFRPDSHTNKATPHGALIYYLDNFVTGRLARWTYGTDCDPIYNREDPEHQKRKNSSYEDLSGHLYLKHGFGVILPQFTRVEHNKLFSCSVVRENKRKEALEIITVRILAYRGGEQYPRWTDVEHDKWRVVGEIEVDTSTVAKTLRPLRGPFGTYFEIELNVMLDFSLTELKAFVQWEEKGKLKRHGS